MAIYMELSPCDIGLSCCAVNENNTIRKNGVVIDETKMFLRVRFEEGGFDIRFSKKDYLPYRADKLYLPDYKLELDL
ncbi:hypothetical protein [Pseudoalteromonas sp. NGC95]|uniref:hypothetical protein n=1 Tax=Pseudoalteromonas sp. NGC95 TaxID=2792051 RepID=UPI0018CF0649|nr:hypothetical protein [Pseudoalteromonas sp. NGC95]MBH0017890.1 hypothetical protein [Pseudoalteromonas sp. NGC95]